MFDAEVDQALDRLSGEFPAEPPPYEVDLEVEDEAEVDVSGEIGGDNPPPALSLDPRARLEPPVQVRAPSTVSVHGNGSYTGGNGSFEHGSPERGQFERGQFERGQVERAQFVERGTFERGPFERGTFERGPFERPGFERGASVSPEQAPAPPTFGAPDDFGDERGSYPVDRHHAPMRAASVYPPVAPGEPFPPSGVPAMPTLAGYRAATDPSAVYGPASYTPAALTGPIQHMTGPIPQLGMPQMMGSQYPSYSGIPYIVQPVITSPATGPRWIVVLVLALFGTTALGLGVGWLLFATQHGGMVGATRGDALSAAPEAPATPPGAAATPAEGAGAVLPPEPASPPPPTRAAPIVVDIASLEHAPLPPVTSSLRGEVIQSALRSERRVAKGEKLFEIKRKVTSEAQAELAAKIAELKRLAQEDPVYEAFLARARDEYRRAQRTEIISIKAAEESFADPRVARGDRVDPGQLLATMSDPRKWIAQVKLDSTSVTRDWRCGIASADDGYRAICRIDEVIVRSSGTELIASVEASHVPWLIGIEQRPRLILEPAAAK